MLKNLIDCIFLPCFSHGEDWQPLHLYRNSLVHGEGELPTVTSKRPYMRKRKAGDDDDSGGKKGDPCPSGKKGDNGGKKSVDSDDGDDDSEYDSDEDSGSEDDSDYDSDESEDWEEEGELAQLMKQLPMTHRVAQPAM